MVNKTLQFRVEAHGTGQLAMVGGVLRSYGYTHEPLLTRVNAWEIVKSYMRAEYHTVKVLRGCEAVFVAYRNADGTWHSPRAGRTYSPAA